MEAAAAGDAYTDVDRRLADTMSSYWVNFVKTGDPNGPGLHRWPAYELTSEPYLELSATIRAGARLLERELDFQEKAQMK